MRRHEDNAGAVRTGARVSRASIHDGAKARSLHFTVLTMVLAAAAAAGTFLVGARAGAALNGRVSHVSIAGMPMPQIPAAKAAALPH